MDPLIAFLCVLLLLMAFCCASVVWLLSGATRAISSRSSLEDRMAALEYRIEAIEEAAEPRAGYEVWQTAPGEGEPD